MLDGAIAVQREHPAEPCEPAALLTHAVRLLREHPSVRGEYRQRWRHVLVDEFQDTDAAQRALVDLDSAET